MVRLSEHGNEVARLEITRSPPGFEPYRQYYSFRTDGSVLINRDSRGWEHHYSLPASDDVYADMFRLAYFFRAEAVERGDTVDAFYTT